MVLDVERVETPSTGSTAGEEGVFQKTEKAGGSQWSSRDEGLFGDVTLARERDLVCQRRPDHVSDASRCVTKLRRPRAGL